MHIQSSFLRLVISAAVDKMLRKQGYLHTSVELNDLRVNYTEDKKKVRVHLDIDAEMSDTDLRDILSKAGII